MEKNHRTTLLVALTTLMVAALITAQLISAKLALLSLPIIGAVAYPTGTIAYAATFFATDLTSELYGKTTARRLVNIAFLANFVMLALVWIAIVAPHGGGVEQSQFATVLGFSTHIVIGSMVAYLISQNWDVTVFHKVRSFTGVDHLWLRNMASTGTSQFIDTVVFITVAFVISPTLLGIGQAMPLAALGSIILGQYILKLAIAVIDTPLVYLAVYGVRRSGNYVTNEDGVLVGNR